MRLFFFISVLSFVFFACSSKDKIPAGTLTINQMKPIIWDLMKAQELAGNDTAKKNIDFKDSATLLFENVFALHHISKNTFYTSYNYYIQNSSQLDILMDSVSAFANRERYAQYMHPPSIPGNPNPQYNHSLPKNILKPKLLNKKIITKKDSLLQKKILP